MGSLLLDVTIKGTLALLATGAAVAVLRGASAATRHAVWTMGMASALALPALSQLLPGWNVGLLPARPAGLAGTAVAESGGVDAGMLLALAWAAGAAIVAASIALGRIRIWWIARGSVALDQGEIPALATALCGEMGISRRVTVRLCPARVMPMVWGLVRPVILLPVEAVGWPAELKRDVLLHELAHVRRHDYLNQLVSRLTCAVHWFNPLAWIAARRLRVEREQACDDHVLRTGASACDYAEHLLTVARRLRPAGRGTLGVAMACRSAFGERVAALLDAGRTRDVLTNGLLLRSGVGAACLVLPLAALHPAARSGASEEPPPAPLVGPPPSANARAAGALPGSRPRPAAPAPAERSRPARTPHAPRSNERPATKISRVDEQEPIAVFRAPEIRAVIHLAGSSAGAGDAAGGTEHECSESTTPASGRTAPTPVPKLAWIPAAEATP